MTRLVDVQPRPRLASVVTPTLLRLVAELTRFFGDEGCMAVLLPRRPTVMRVQRDGRALFVEAIDDPWPPSAPLPANHVLVRSIAEARVAALSAGLFVEVRA